MANPIPAEGIIKAAKVDDVLHRGSG